MMEAEQERRRCDSPDHDDRHRRVRDRKSRNRTHARRTERAAPRLESRPGAFRTDHKSCNVSDVSPLRENNQQSRNAHSLVGTARSS
jgi:hypothetical protein